MLLKEGKLQHKNPVWMLGGKSRVRAAVTAQRLIAYTWFMTVLGCAHTPSMFIAAYSHTGAFLPFSLAHLGMWEQCQSSWGNLHLKNSPSNSSQLRCEGFSSLTWLFLSGVLPSNQCKSDGLARCFPDFHWVYASTGFKLCNTTKFGHGEISEPGSWLWHTNFE